MTTVCSPLAENGFSNSPYCRWNSVCAGAGAAAAGTAIRAAQRVLMAAASGIRNSRSRK